MDWRNKPNQIFNKVKQQMFGKGVESFHFVDRMHNDFDPDHSGLLTSHAFNLFTNKIGVFFTTQEIRNIRDLYRPAPNQDAIRYKEFFQDVKYSMPQSVARLVGQAYEKLDPHNSDAVPFEHLLSAYNPTQHPHVLSRKKSPQEVREFFETAMGRKVVDGHVTRPAFVDYYAELSFCIPNERQSYFQQLLIGTWGLNPDREYVPPKRVEEIQKVIYEKIREKSDGKNSEWKAGKKALSYFDLGDRGDSDFAGFKAGLDKFGCVFRENELHALFDKHAVDGRLNYEYFVKQIMDIDISGLSSKTNLLTSKMGTNHFTIKN